jgi:4-hydroxy-2-oxoheptanedioate aldolase
VDTDNTHRVAEFAERVRRRRTVIGYWISAGNPAATERISRLGYDYVVLDGQHGLIDARGLLDNLVAIDAGGCAVGLIRVEANHPAPIGRALDSGAAGVIVPLINSAEDAAAAVAAARYPPQGIRSYGPTRSALRIGPQPAVTNATVLVLGMIETAAGLADVERIAATPGLDGLYVGPSDLTLGVGGAYPGDPAAAEALARALDRVRAACGDRSIVAGIYCPSGEDAAAKLAAGFSFVTVASDLSHLEEAARAHLDGARAAASD